MPKKVEITPDNFYAFVERMNAAQFVLLNKQQTITYLPYKTQAEQLYRIPARKKGLQAILMHENRHFVTLALTTFDETAGKMKGSDEGWVLTVDRRFPLKPSFYSFPMNRTMFFLSTMEGWARALKNRVETMPHCETCGTLLRIVLIKSRDEVPTRKDMHKYSLLCPNNACTRKSRFSNFYEAMDRGHARFIAAKFRRYDSYFKKEEEQGINRDPDRLSRAFQKKKKNIRYDANVYMDGDHLE